MATPAIASAMLATSFKVGSWRRMASTQSTGSGAARLIRLRSSSSLPPSITAVTRPNESSHKIRKHRLATSRCDDAGRPDSRAHERLPWNWPGNATRAAGRGSHRASLRQLLGAALHAYILFRTERAGAKFQLSLVRAGHAQAQTDPLRLRWLSPRTLSHRPRPFATAGEGTHLSVRRPKQIGSAARRGMALSMARQGQCCSTRRRALANWLQPYSATRLRRDRRPRCQS